MKIALLVDNPKSWIVPYAKKLSSELKKRGHDVVLINSAEAMPEGDCAVFLSCEKMVPADIRARNTHNIVVHGSALPEGKGWSPLTWQILEGRTDIPVTLFEAGEAVDSGDVYAEGTLHFEGHELVDELRERQGELTIALVLEFLETFPPKGGRKQKGTETFYRRRTPKDSELDPDKSIAEQFNLLRVVDNERYPAFFRHRGHTYELKIYKKEK